MKKIFFAGLIAGVVLLILSILGLYMTVWFFPGIAIQYFNPVFDMQSSRTMIYFLHPFIIGFALSWFWSRFKGVVQGSFFTRGIEFGLIYIVIATIPMLWLIYSSINVSLEIVGTWLVLALLQGTIAGLIFEKMNP